MILDCRCLDGFSTVIAGLVDPRMGRAQRHKLDES
jgi:hypothetical protein